MHIYGFLLDELLFAPNQKMQFICDMAQKETKGHLPPQVECGFDVNGDNPYFGIVPVFTRKEAYYDTLSDAKKILCEMIHPYLTMPDNDIQNVCGFIALNTERNCN